MSQNTKSKYKKEEYGSFALLTPEISNLHFKTPTRE